MTDEQTTPTPAHELTIFISYRRSDTRADAGRLYDALRRRFGKDQLFMDVDSLQPGQDWVAAVEDAVRRCDVLLALIGDEWSTVVDAGGRRRIEDDLDRVRLEIEAALKADKPVIPVLFEEAHMPGADELPESLQTLRRRQAMRLAHDTFRYDLEPLVHALRTIEAGKRAKLGLPPRSERAERVDRSERLAGMSERAATNVGPPTAPVPAVETPPLAAQAVPPVAAAVTPSPTAGAPVPPVPAPYPQPNPYPQPFAGPAQPFVSPQPQPQSWPPQQPAQPPYPQANPYVRPGYQTPAQWGAQRSGAAANPISLVAVVLAVVSALVLPIIFGPAAIVVGVVARFRKEPWANVAIIVAIACMIIGFLLGALVYLA